MTKVLFCIAIWGQEFDESCHRFAVLLQEAGPNLPFKGFCDTDACEFGGILHAVLRLLKEKAVHRCDLGSPLRPHATGLAWGRVTEAGNTTVAYQNVHL